MTEYNYEYIMRLLPLSLTLSLPPVGPLDAEKLVRAVWLLISDVVFKASLLKYIFLKIIIVLIAQVFNRPGCRCRPK